MRRSAGRVLASMLDGAACPSSGSRGGYFEGQRAGHWSLEGSGTGEAQRTSRDVPCPIALARSSSSPAWAGREVRERAGKTPHARVAFPVAATGSRHSTRHRSLLVSSLVVPRRYAHGCSSVGKYASCRSLSMHRIDCRHVLIGLLQRQRSLRSL